LHNATKYAILEIIFKDGECSVNEYFLFLDESKPTALIYFFFAGCIIDKDEYVTTIIPAVNKLKTDVFAKTDIILHETEVRKAKGDFACMVNPNKRESFWEGMHRIFAESNMKIIGAGVSSNTMKNVYRSKNLNSYYHITLQLILENYAYFLEQNNAKGSVIIESVTEQKQLLHLYHNIVSNGTLFLGKNIYLERLSGINFYIKEDNNIGLQLADFIPNPINRNMSDVPQKDPTLYDIIQTKLYDGAVGNEERFGIKIIRKNH
jgi:hypothetical protein